MEPILQWGLDFIRTVQTATSGELTAVMRIITVFGGWYTYMTLIAIIYWGVDEKKGLQAAYVILISVWLNLMLKYLLNQPRPFFENYDPSVSMISERLGGLPSGHAQNSLVMFFIIASWTKKNWAYICAAVICFLIGFSRIYLGVHFPSDVLAGWLLGGIIFCGYFFLHARIEALLARGGFRAGIYASAVVSFIMILYLPSEEMLALGGVLLGIGAGYCLNRRYTGFSSSAQLERTGIKKYLILAVRFVLGTVALMLFIFAIGKIIPQIANSSNKKLYGFICYTLAGLLVSFAMPWIFVKLRLAGVESKQ